MAVLSSFDVGDRVQVQQAHHKAAITGTLLVLAGDVALVANEAHGLDPRPVAVPANSVATAA